MKTLFIDTHSPILTIIIKKNEETFTSIETSNKSHSEIAIPTIKKVLEDAKIDISQIDNIIVVNGPGSFTGVRIGVTIAKTLAFVKNIPIKTISSLEMCGVSSEEEFDVVTVTDSKGVYSATLENGNYTNFNYYKTDEFNEIVKKNNYKILNSKTINIDKILNYLKDKDCINPHLVNPIYIKKIDALK